MFAILVLNNAGDNDFTAFTCESFPSLGDKRRAYEMVFGEPTHPDELASDFTIAQYTRVVQLHAVNG